MYIYMYMYTQAHQLIHIITCTCRYRNAIHVKVVHVHRKNVHNFSLELSTIFLHALFSYNYPSHSFFVFVKIKSIASLLSYSVIMF